MYNKQMFRTQKTIFPEVAASTTASVASSISVNGPVTVTATTGSVWVNAAGTATTDSHKLWEGNKSIDLEATGTLSLISDSTTAKYQAIAWNY